MRGSATEAAPVGERDVGEEFEESGVFVGAGGAEAGADLIEVLVRVAGVADEFPRGVGHIGGQSGEQAAEGLRDVEGASGEDADGAAGGGER